ncbi:hypothetical protein [Chryseobacterium gallinarum]|nr:hypothetical protein [Chryseobacterium gallinarum]
MKTKTLKFSKETVILLDEVTKKSSQQQAGKFSIVAATCNAQCI